MNGFYEKLLSSGLNLAPLGWERCGDFEPYFCTPRGARVFGAAGVDGIHYCTIPGFGRMIFAVNPIGCDSYVHPIARSFRDLLRLLLAGADLAALEQCHAWDEEQYRAFLREYPPTEEQQALRAKLRETFALEPMEDPFRYVKDLQKAFDLSRIPYSAEYYDTLGEPAPAEAAEWRVTFPGGFWSREGEAGKEIPLDRRFRWNGRDWRVPAVYLCPEGLVMDLAMEVDPAKYRSFLEKWDLTEGEPAELTAAQREGIQRENPLNVDFRAKIEWNGATARQKSGCGVGWLTADCLPEGMENDDCAAAILAHYGLDEGRCWSLHRQSFPFPHGAAGEEPRSLTLRLAAEKARFSGEPFLSPAPGESVALTPPLTGAEYRLTVTELTREALPPSAFPDPALEYPTHLTAMGYTLAPEHGSFSLRDCAEGDRPRRRASAGGGADGPVCAAVAGVIGGADGPIAVIPGGRGTPRAAVSALYFDPPETIRWQPVFREKTAEDITVELL